MRRRVRARSFDPQGWSKEQAHVRVDSHERFTLAKWLNPIKNYWLAIAGMLIVAIVLEVGLTPEQRKGWTLIFLFAILISSGAACFFSVKNQHLLVWTPIVWITFAFGVFYGLGPMVYYFGDEKNIKYLGFTWEVNTGDLWNTMLVNLLGFFFVLLAFLAGSYFTPTIKKARNIESSSLKDAKSLALIFISIGSFMNYFIILPYSLGLTKWLLPGFFFNLALLQHIGILLISYLHTKSDEMLWKVLFYTILPLELLTSFLTFSKQAFLLIFILAFLGKFLAHRRITILLTMACVVSFVFITIKPIVSDARIELRKDSYGVASLSKRLAIIQKVLRKEDDDWEDYGGNWWTRICYAHVQAFTMERYELGLPGNTYSNILYTFVPRLLWPEKPNMSLVGLEFTELVSGHRASSTGLGVFGEAYWNLGYMGVGLIGFYIGILFLILSQATISFIFRQDWYFLPLVFFGIKIGLSVDRWFVSSYVGSIVIYAAYFFFLYVAKQVKIFLDSQIKV